MAQGKRTPNKTWDKLLQILETEQVGSIHIACQQLGIDRRTFYYYKSKNPDFAAKVDAVVEPVTLSLVEDQLLKQAFEGNLRAVTFYLIHRAPKKWNQQVSQKREFFLLERDQKQQLRELDPQNMQVDDDSLTQKALNYYHQLVREHYAKDRDEDGNIIE